MSKRTVVLAAVVGCLLLPACGTQVDEASTAPSFVIQGGGNVAGGTADSGTTGSGGDTAAGSAATGGATDGGGTAGGTGGGGTGAGTSGDTSGGASGGGGATGGGASTGGSGPASGDPIRLGAVGTRSGLVGAALENSWRGLFVWQEWVNANGGIQGRPVEVIAFDDTGDPGKHAAGVRTLILDDHVVAFIGNFAPLTLSAGIPILEEHGIPAIGGDGGEASWFTSAIAFPINGQTVSRSRPAADWALANLPQRKAAVFYVSEAEAPQRLGQNFADQWRKGGGEVVVEGGVSLVQPDFTSEIIRARNAGADIVYTVLEKAACNRFFDSARRQQYRPVFLTAACTIDNAREANDLTTGSMYPIHAARPVKGSSPAEEEIRQAVATYDPSLPPDGAFMFGWLGGTLLEEAMAQPGTELTPSGIISALNQLPPTSLGGLTPTQSWPPGPHEEGRCGMVSLFDGTEFVLQTPDFVCSA